MHSDYDDLIALRDVPRHLPPRPSGRRVHVSAIYRWLRQGLPHFRIGGTTYTTLAALRSWGAQRTTSPIRRDRLVVPNRRIADRAAREAASILGVAKEGNPK